MRRNGALDGAGRQEDCDEHHEPPDPARHDPQSTRRPLSDARGADGAMSVAQFMAAQYDTNGYRIGNSPLGATPLDGRDWGPIPTLLVALT